MLKTGALALTTMALSFFVAASLALAQTESPTPSATPMASSSPTTTMTTPSAAPSTGHAE